MNIWNASFCSSSLWVWDSAESFMKWKKEQVENQQILEDGQLGQSGSERQQELKKSRR